MGNSVKKLYDKNIGELYFDSRIEDFTGFDKTKLFYHMERFIKKRSVFDQPETFQEMVDQIYIASPLYESKKEGNPGCPLYMYESESLGYLCLPCSLYSFLAE